MVRLWDSLPLSLEQRYEGMVQLTQYSLRLKSLRVFEEEVTTGVVLELIVEIDRRLAAWGNAIQQTGSDYLREKLVWVKGWMEECGKPKLYSAAFAAAFRNPLESRKFDRKIKEFLDVVNALESVPDELEEKFEALLDWIVEIPVLVEALATEEPISQEYDQSETFHHDVQGIPRMGLGMENLVMAC